MAVRVGHLHKSMMAVVVPSKLEAGENSRLGLGIKGASAETVAIISPVVPHNVFV